MKGYLSIGKVSKAKNVSIKSLRYYDEIGIFKPALTDHRTGYRYYKADQLYILDVISFCIELGIPFSDPTAEGPVIQGANIRALAGGVTTDRVFDLVRSLRKDISTPMVFMTYANVVFSYGAEEFLSTCQEIGMDGIILPDLPFEEKDEFQPLCKKYGVDLIS